MVTGVTKLLCTNERAPDRSVHTIAILESPILYSSSYLISGSSGTVVGGKGSGQKTSRFKKYRRSVPHGYPSSLLSDAIRRSYDNASSVTTNQAAQPQLLAPLTLVSTYNPNNLDLFPFIRSLLPQTRGFQNRYENDLDFAHGIHKIIALCFIHPDNIIDGFGRLSIGLYPSFQEILDYFEDTYI
ncbi:unnamed protein product, partial [Didymodactylos carnosus]